MGLSSSQARLLSLTARMHDIEYKAARLEAQKLQMANESRRVHEDYLNALDKTKIQHKTLTTNGAVTFIDTNLYNLMFGGSDGPGSFGAGPRFNSTSLFFGNGASSGTASVPHQYALFSTKNGFMYVPKKVKEAYEDAFSAEDFADTLSSWVPTHESTGEGISGIDNPSEPLTSGSNTNYPHVPDPTAQYNISRNSKTKTAKIDKNQTDVRLHVYDGVTKTESNYIITTGSTGIKATIMDNGRLLFEGNDATIKAAEHQNDNLLIKGGGNTIYTYDGDDIVRVNDAKDSSLGGSVYGIGMPWADYAPPNTIDTGSGNDYVQSEFGDYVTMGEGDDYLLGYNESADNGTIEHNYTFQPIDGNNQYGWGMQNGYGDCQLLAFLNGLMLSGTLSDYIKIENASGGGWNVKFLASNENVPISQSDIGGGVSGDIDNKIIEAAMLKLIQRHGVDYSEGGGGLGKTSNYYLISKYIFGVNDSGVTGGADNFTDAQFRIMLEAAQNGQITNLVVATTQSGNSNEKLGIVNQHAYTVDAKNSVAGEYVTLINPWDNRDRINLAWEDFLKFFDIVLLAGDSFQYYVDHCEGGNVANIKYKSTNISNAPEGEILVGDDPLPETDPEDPRYQYFINLYFAIEEAGGCETFPEDMVYSNEFLTNMLNNGFAYLKMFDNKTGEWVDTSVAVNTSLQEVSDEVELRKAEAKYEADMKRIDMKDRRYDSELAALDNERNAIKQEMETVKTVAKDNVERTFRLFT